MVWIDSARWRTWARTWRRPPTPYWRRPHSPPLGAPLLPLTGGEGATTPPPFPSGNLLPYFFLPFYLLFTLFVLYSLIGISLSWFFLSHSHWHPLPGSASPFFLGGGATTPPFFLQITFFLFFYPRHSYYHSFSSLIIFLCFTNSCFPLYFTQYPIFLSCSHDLLP